MEWIDWLLHGGRYLVAAVTLSLALLASGHAIIWKRDSRSAVLWVVVIWLVPLAGPLLYLLLGVNRIETRATALRREDGRTKPAPQDQPGTPARPGQRVVPEAL